MEYLMKPYLNRGLSIEQQIFNYRLSRAWRVVENAIGVPASRFSEHHKHWRHCESGEHWFVLLCSAQLLMDRELWPSTWQVLLTRKDQITTLFQDDGEKTLTYSRPPFHTQQMLQHKPSSTGMDYAIISCLTLVQCLFSGTKDRICEFYSLVSLNLFLFFITKIKLCILH